jgi:hypothetical protein
VWRLREYVRSQQIHLAGNFGIASTFFIGVGFLATGALVLLSLSSRSGGDGPGGLGWLPYLSLAVLLRHPTNNILANQASVNAAEEGQGIPGETSWSQKLVCGIGEGHGCLRPVQGPFVGT